MAVADELREQGSKKRGVNQSADNWEMPGGLMFRAAEECDYLLQLGVSYKKIGERFGVSADSVRMWVKRRLRIIAISIHKDSTGLDLAVERGCAEKIVIACNAILSYDAAAERADEIARLRQRLAELEPAGGSQ